MVEEAVGKPDVDWTERVHAIQVHFPFRAPFRLTQTDPHHVSEKFQTPAVRQGDHEFPQDLPL
jgi:hypothetical protein